jgi:cbb3-type cytochrome oxidase cytochrome c subunit
MNYGPLIFLAAFFALGASWFGLVLTPQMQVGRLQQTNTVPAHETYPVGRPGLAREGLEVYRANGCQYCHSQQPGQTGTACKVVLNDSGTNQALMVAALRIVNPDWTEEKAKDWLAETKLPETIREGLGPDEADAMVKTLSVGGAKAERWVMPTGPDIPRWGQRRTVAEDYLYDSPVMLGSQRIGPDLANVGTRLPDLNWHLLHLYAPELEVQGSAMAPYRFLFEKHKIEQAPSPEALSLPPKYAPPAGFEMVPKPEAKALVAYLLSLRADAPLFVAPLTVPAAPPPTNAPAEATNSAATNSPGK